MTTITPYYSPPFPYNSSSVDNGSPGPGNFTAPPADAQDYSTIAGPSVLTATASQIDPSLEENNVGNGETNPTDASADGRKCSVRGCGEILPSAYKQKMCDACRGRHRVYATTKRAKRKLEKAAVNGGLNLNEGQNNNDQEWIHTNPQNQNGQDQVTEDLHVSPELASQSLDAEHHESDPYVYPTTGEWALDTGNIDPRLFTESTSSELAGALSLPGTSTDQQSSSTSSASGSISYQEHAVATALGPSPESREDAVPLGDQVPDPNSPNPDQTDASQQATAQLPTRYCSVKGCKATIPQGYFYKMCEPCRDRYRGYGTTKRAKWKRERIAMRAELERVKAEEDKRRVEAGLPLLSELAFNRRQDWEMKVLNNLAARAKEGTLLDRNAADPANADPGRPIRMCTVSHCHAILSGNYGYRRCEQHRKQNRYHSKMKRVREKEVKGQTGTSQDWAGEGTKADGEGEEGEELNGEMEEGEEESSGGEEQEETQDGIDPSVTTLPAAQFVSDAAEIPLPTPPLPQKTAPPPVRGGRRSNHVCSVRQCCNLLDPKVPWKMCESCRARDREVRSNRSKSKKKKEEKEKTGDGIGETSAAAGERADNGTENTAEEASLAVAQDVDIAPGDIKLGEESAHSDGIFADPLVPQVEGSQSDVPQADVSQVETCAEQASAPQVPETTYADAVSSPELHITVHDISSHPDYSTRFINSNAHTLEEGARKKKKRLKAVVVTPSNKDGGNNDANKRSAYRPVAPAPSSSDAITHEMSPFPYMQPPYPIPYYMPAPYGPVPPYGAQHPYPYAPGPPSQMPSSGGSQANPQYYAYPPPASYPYPHPYSAQSSPGYAYQPYQSPFPYLSRSYVPPSSYSSHYSTPSYLNSAPPYSSLSHAGPSHSTQSAPAAGSSTANAGSPAPQSAYTSGTLSYTDAATNRLGGGGPVPFNSFQSSMPVGTSVRSWHTITTPMTTSERKRKREESRYPRDERRPTEPPPVLSLTPAFKVQVPRFSGPSSASATTSSIERKDDSAPTTTDSVVESGSTYETFWQSVQTDKSKNAEPDTATGEPISALPQQDDGPTTNDGSAAPVNTNDASGSLSEGEVEATVSAEPFQDGLHPQHERQSESPQDTRACGNKSCHRRLPTAASGTFCERCKARLKKRQAKVKQRHHLEPRKPLVGRSGSGGDLSTQGVSVESSGLAQAE